MGMLYRSTVLDTELRLRGHRHPADLIGSDVRGCLVAVPLDDPGLVVGLLERDERQAKFLDRGEVLHPAGFLQHPDEPFGTAIAFGLATKAGELSMPRKRISAWKWWLTYWLP